MSSDSTTWRTPEWFLELVRSVGDIYLDPATTDANPTGALVWITQGPGGCGLSLDWHEHAQEGLCFVNPPYGKALGGSAPDPKRNRGWAAKMASFEGEALYLVPARTETKWFRRLHDWADWRLDWSSPEHGSRIRFVGADGKAEHGAPFPSTVFYRGNSRMKRMRFIEVFAPHGTMIKAESW